MLRTLVVPVLCSIIAPGVSSMHTRSAGPGGAGLQACSNPDQQFTPSQVQSSPCVQFGFEGGQPQSMQPSQVTNVTGSHSSGMPLTLQSLLVPLATSQAS